MDVEDRALRSIVAGLGGSANAPLRETGFDIVTASEIMAVLALSRDLDDLRERLSRIVVGYRDDDSPVTAEEVNAVGSLMALLRYAILPNLVQTTEGQPVIVHAGPFGNIAHGCSSVVGDLLALGYADYVLSEAGFGADLGFEKFMHLKARSNGLEPSAAVLVATVRAVKYHGGVAVRELETPDKDAVRRGMENLTHLIGVVRAMGLPVVVAVNHFPTDTQGETELVMRGCEDAGALCRRRKPRLLRRRRRRHGAGRGVGAGDGRPAPGNLLLLPGGRLHPGQGAVARPHGLQRQRRQLEHGIASAVEEVRGERVGHPPGVHGQDTLCRCHDKSSGCKAKARPATTFQVNDVQGVGGGRLHLPHRGQHRHDARPAVVARTLDVDAAGNILNL